MSRPDEIPSVVAEDYLDAIERSYMIKIKGSPASAQAGLVESAQEVARKALLDAVQKPEAERKLQQKPYSELNGEWIESMGTRLRALRPLPFSSDLLE